MDKKHLNKIVGYLLDDIEIHYDYQSVQIIGSDIEYDIEGLSDRFFGKVWDILEYDYGLNTDECLYVYGNLLYQINIKMKDYGSINESINSRGDYLNKIVEYLLEDTEIDYNNRSVNLLFLHPPMLLYFFPYPLPSPILEYCKDVYGLNDDETNYVLREYKNTIVDKINNLPINESVDNKKIYLDKIVQYIIDDTVIDYDKNLCKLPYLHNPIPIIPPFIIPSPYYYSFLSYCEDIYGLTDDEIEYVWEEYKSIVDDKGSINESVDSKKIYLDKIVQYMLDDTKLDYGRKEVIYPFIPNVRSQWGLLVPLYYVQYDSPFFNEYSKYCNDTYGLTSEESVYVWGQYKDKINNSGSY